MVIFESPRFMRGAESKKSVGVIREQKLIGKTNQTLTKILAFAATKTADFTEKKLFRGPITARELAKKLRKKFTRFDCSFSLTLIGVAQISIGVNFITYFGRVIMVTVPTIFRNHILILWASLVRF